jgi:hypothetical protein
MTTIREKLKFIRNTACVIIAAEAALVSYGEYQGSLDIRVYGTKEQAYQAQLHRAEAEVARYAFSGGQDEEVQTAQAEPVYSVFDAPKHHHGK